MHFAPDKTRRATRWLITSLISCLILSTSAGNAQDRQRAGKSIGKISTSGGLIVLELDKGALGNANLFDLEGRSLRFSPVADAYRVENIPLQWDHDFGSELSEFKVRLHNFSFPFAGKSWDSLLVGGNGSIRFDQADSGSERGISSDGGPLGEISIGRFDQLSEAAASLVNSVTGICVFLKPRMSGTRYAKELQDRLVVTWDLTEPFGNIQDFTWVKTVNRFQAVLFRNGTVEMSYQEMAAKDAIVGLFPELRTEHERVIATLAGTPHPGIAAHLDLEKVTISVIHPLILKITLETRGAVLKEGDPNLGGIVYRVHFTRTGAPTPREDPSDVVWTVRGVRPPRPLGGRSSRYVAFGPGLSRRLQTGENTISIQGIVPPPLRGVRQVEVTADAAAARDENSRAEVPRRTVDLPRVESPELDLSLVRSNSGPYPLLYETFHYLRLPNPRDLTCTVINALGDRFDFLAYYSDFRVDNQEAGTPSTGPRGGRVTGIGVSQGDLSSYCSQGRFQWQFVQPVYVGSNQMFDRPPAGAPVGSNHDITFYEHQLAEGSSGKMPPFNYAMSQIGHEMGHRWGADATAKVNGDVIQLGPTHWDRGLQAPAAFPYKRPIEASAMGGGVWQDNLDGTFSQLDDDYYVPATGWSHLDLYLMGMISAAEVPDFFLLRNLVPVGKDANGHAIFRADRTKITIHDVIAAEGPRLPAVDHAQKQFNTGLVMVVEHGRAPSEDLIERTGGIRKAWIDYWETTTGHRSTMTADPE
jgi:hypothetical protein